MKVFAACDDFCPKIQSTAFVFPCPHLSDGETSSKYRHSALDETTRSRRSEEDPFIFCFSPCLRASVVQRSCLWLRLRRAAFPGLTIYGFFVAGFEVPVLRGVAGVVVAGEDAAEPPELQ